MEALNPVLQPMLRVWRGLSRPQQIGLGVILAAGLGLLFIVSTVGRGADMGVAFSGLSDQDAAAVVDKLKPGRRFDSAKARSITGLVASGVKGLKPQNVTIVDVNGNTLTGDDSTDPTTGMNSKQLDAQRGYEANAEHDLQALLD